MPPSPGPNKGALDWRLSRRRRDTLQTVREVDASEVARLRKDVHDAMMALAEEVMAHKKTLGEIRDIVADELRKRA